MEIKLLFKVGVPVWEDFLSKAAKLHSQLKATILSTTAFLDAFQKIADLATNTRGATKEVGTALTRICLRQKAVEARLKTFTSALMECLVLPLQDKMEDWKKSVAQLDKDHAKEYKRARQEIKKRSSDTLRLQKKVRKGRSEIQRCLDSALQDVSDKFIVLEETEKHALRSALVEERSRFCLFVSYLKPVVDEEVAMLSETAHLQEVMDVLLKNTTDPFTLPPSSEQVITDLKNSEGSWSFQTPPSSPSSISSRKSSMCSISSVNSSSSGSTKCHSPGRHIRYRSHSQPLVVGAPLRLPSVSSQDSGFTSQDTLFVHPPPSLDLMKQMSDTTAEVGPSSGGSMQSYGTLPMATSTWPNLQLESGQYEQEGCPIVGDRPHTISTAYERGHLRPALTVHTFEPLDCVLRQVNSMPSSPQGYDGQTAANQQPQKTDQPAIPKRAVSLERPIVPSKSSKVKHSKLSCCTTAPVLPDFHQPSPNQIIPQPVYVNMDDLMQQQQLRREAESPQRQIYGITTTTMTLQEQRSSGFVENEGGLERLAEATNYCTMPRCQRPTSTATGFTMSPYGTLQTRTGSLRRSTSQSHKPPPPVRRTSSITSQHGLTVVALRSAQSSQSLASMSVTTSMDRLRLADADFPPPPPPPPLPPHFSVVRSHSEEEQQQQSLGKTVHGRKSLPSMSTSDIALTTVRKASLEDSVAVNKANLIQSLNARLLLQQSRKTPSTVEPLDGSKTRDQGFQDSFLHDLNAKLAQHVQKNAGLQPQQQQPALSFKDELSAKLASKVGGGGAPTRVVRGDGVPESSGPDVATRVRQLMASRRPYDPVTCRESLLDQIKRGAALRPVATDDRSAPRIQ